MSEGIRRKVERAVCSSKHPDRTVLVLECGHHFVWHKSQMSSSQRRGADKTLFAECRLCAEPQPA